MLLLYMDKEIQTKVLVLSIQAITDWEISSSFYSFVWGGRVIIHSIYIFSLNWNFMYARILLYCWATFLCQFIMFGAYIFMSLSNMGFVYWLMISQKNKPPRTEIWKQTNIKKSHYVFLASPSHLWAVIFFYFFFAFFCFPKAFSINTFSQAIFTAGTITVDKYLFLNNPMESMTAGLETWLETWLNALSRYLLNMLKLNTQNTSSCNNQKLQTPIILLIYILLGNSLTLVTHWSVVTFH